MQGVSEGQAKLKVLKISAIAIFSVVIVEVIIGLVVNSLAIISDGLHALLDGFTSVMLFFAVRAAMKPADEEHTYGHEKFETIGGLIGGVVLIVVAVLIFYEAAIRLISNVVLSGSIEYAGFIAIAYALFIASLRVTVFKRNGNNESPSMKAGLYDAIADLSSTLIALLGFGLALFGVNGADALASIFLGAMLTYLSLRLLRVSVNELSDSASKELIELTKKLIISCQGVVKIQTLKVRQVSSKVFVDASVQVPSVLSLEDSHAIASTIENCLKDGIGNVEATIHVEPADKDHSIYQQIQKYATIDGVKEVHEISTNYVGGKLYITLHAYVNPDLTVEESHKIAEGIERKVHKEIKNIENITVHLEPTGLIQSEQVNEAKLRRILYDVAKNVDEKIQVRRVVAYSADGKRYINIDCGFTKSTSIKHAHRIASLLEKETKERFASAVVTVHIEPQ
jgi:cation diffusion facilitator family transporter